ncbi:MAG TPA: malto-oligosyltrehalose trehalohydrolase [Chitinophagaceae bacterium]|nr:malto-oligosyltrehalose trehalohydrolase [Chitinophagaceae bacterium]
MNIGSSYLSNGKTEFKVWAPLKDHMSLHIVHPFDNKIKMEKDSSGYFLAEVEVSPGCRYFFMPGKERDLPDPGSKSQPLGVHGPSEVIDNSFNWEDEKWKGIPFDELIFYELHVGTFTEEGTFDSMIPKLDHLLETGINAIEIMPVAQFPGTRNWGYDGVYPYAVQNSYGGSVGLKRLVKACHQKGIAVFLDVVYNHLGPEGNYLEEFAPYFTEHYKTPWGKAINFDGTYSDEVRAYFSENAIYFFEDFHIDGLRFDAIHQVYDMGAVHFWELLHKKIARLEQKLGRSLYTIAESDFNSPRVIKPIELGGYGFTAQWLDDFHHALYTLVDQEGRQLYADFGSIEQLAKAFKDGFVLSGEYVNFRKRKFGASSAGVSGDKFVVFIDNHDQAGNRLTGNRLSTLISYEKLKLASASYLLSPYIPMLFMGEEYGDNAPFLYFISHSEKELIEMVRKGRKMEFQNYGSEAETPDPYDEGSFIQSKLQWKKIKEKKHDAIHRWYKELIHLRKSHKVLQNFEKKDVRVNTDGELLQLYRLTSGLQNEIICLFNFSETNSFSFTFPSPGWNLVLDSNEERWAIDKTRHKPLSISILPGGKIQIPPLTVLVYENTGS